MPYQQNGNQGPQRNRGRQGNYTLNKTQARQPQHSSLEQRSYSAPYVQPEVHIHIDGNTVKEKKKGFPFSVIVFGVLAVACCAAAVYLLTTV